MTAGKCRLGRPVGVAWTVQRPLLLNSTIGRRMQLQSQYARSTSIVILTSILLHAQLGLAANCELNYTEFTSQSIPPDGMISFIYDCYGYEVCQPPDFAAEFQLSRDAEVVDVSVESVPIGDRGFIVLLRPLELLHEGDYTVTSPIGPEVITVGETAPPTGSADAELKLAFQWLPVGDKVCCPTEGEGDCDPSCYGDLGEQLTAVLQPTTPPPDKHLAWRVVALSAEGTTGEWSTGTWLNEGLVADDPFTTSGATWTTTLDEYCAKLEVWNLVTDERVSKESCTPNDPNTNVGEIERSWRTLRDDFCPAPPVLGGWGTDVGGGVLDDEREPELLDPTEPMRVAWCESRAQCAREDEPPEECLHFDHYCSDLMLPSEPKPDAGVGHEDETDPDDEPKAKPAMDPEETAPDGGCSMRAPKRGGRAPTAAVLLGLLYCWARRKTPRW